MEMEGVFTSEGVNSMQKNNPSSDLTFANMLSIVSQMVPANNQKTTFSLGSFPSRGSYALGGFVLRADPAFVTKDPWGCGITFSYRHLKSPFKGKVPSASYTPLESFGIGLERQTCEVWHG